MTERKAHEESTLGGSAGSAPEPWPESQAATAVPGAIDLELAGVCMGEHTEAFLDALSEGRDVEDYDQLDDEPSRL